MKMNWDEVRYFLAVARDGTVRAAAQRLGVDHSTVLRRVAQLEQQLSAKLFEKMPSGYRLTAAGEEVVQLAEQMEIVANQLQARVLGRDQGVRGRLRATMAPVIASHLLMPDFMYFSQRNPEVEMEILPSDEPVNLTNREADVAIRVVYNRNDLPNNLFGSEGPEVTFGVYMAHELLAACRANKQNHVTWIIKNRYGHPDWCHQSDIPTSEILFRTSDAAAQIAAVRQGLGMTLLPCFVGDIDPLLSRVPGSQQKVYGNLWVLTQGETRKTERVRLFTQFLSERLLSYAPLLAGKTDSRN